jgi:AcrR family transcriptional regulator
MRTRLARADRERQIVTTARALFAARGYGEVTMEDVAAEVGVTKPLLYAYFGNKERLYLTCMQPAGEALIDTVVRAVDGSATPADAFDRGVGAFFEFVAADRESWRVLFDETLPVSGEVAGRVAAYRERLTGLVTESLLAGMPARRRRRAAAEVEALSTALLGAAEALARWWLRTGAMPAAAAAELLVTTVEPGLRARTERGARSR